MACRVAGTRRCGGSGVVGAYFCVRTETKQAAPGNSGNQFPDPGMGKSNAPGWSLTARLPGWQACPRPRGWSALGSPRTESAFSFPVTASFGKMAMWGCTGGAAAESRRCRPGKPQGTPSWSRCAMPRAVYTFVRCRKEYTGSTASAYRKRPLFSTLTPTFVCG